jgi:hypothetical protein
MMKALAGLLLAGALALAAWGAYVTLRPAAPPPAAPSAASAGASGAMDGAPAKGQPEFRCDSRRYCSQMTSCAEARYFLAHCPNVKLDGNHNGVPCEAQWCPGS